MSWLVLVSGALSSHISGVGWGNLTRIWSVSYLILLMRYSLHDVTDKLAGRQMIHSKYAPRTAYGFVFILSWELIPCQGKPERCTGHRVRDRISWLSTMKTCTTQIQTPVGYIVVKTLGFCASRECLISFPLPSSRSRANHVTAICADSATRKPSS